MTNANASGAAIGKIMKRSILLFSLLLSVGFALSSCATDESAPGVSAATGPAGVGTATETGTGNVGGLGAGAGVGIHGGGN